MISIFASHLAKIALLIADTGALDEICASLESGLLNDKSTSTVRAALAGGNSALEAHISALQDIWREHGPSVSANTIAIALYSSAAAAQECRDNETFTQVVWTGPKVEGSYLRSTREVIREIVRGAQHDLFVVGYWIGASCEREGIITLIIDELAESVRRGVSAKVVVDERVRNDGLSNQRVLLDAWPTDVQLPAIFTWELPNNDRHIKLHAKALVADGEDALVTSANLTYYAMERNIEMGVRMKGTPAKLISDHFHRLIDADVLKEY